MTEAARLLADLVRLPSVNPMGRPVTGGDPPFLEHRVTDLLERRLRDLGVPYRRQPVAPSRDNLVAWLESPAAPFTVLFEAHQDTVPVEGMTVDPFGAEVRDGRLYGRGACDVKAGAAAMFAAFARLARERPAGMANVVLAFSVDEEHTFLGVQELTRFPWPRRPDFAVVAEPTNLEIVTAHKGLVRWALETAGRACHSSRPEDGVNAIYKMARLLAAVDVYAPNLSKRLTHPVLGPATVSVGRVEGGSSVNTVPDFCRAEVDRRLVPGETVAGAMEEFRLFLGHAAPGVEFTMSEPWFHCPALDPAGNDAAVGRLAAALGAVTGDHRLAAVPYGTDASTLAEAGIPSVVFGPGDIAQAHTKDEWVDLAQVETAVEVLVRLAHEPRA